MKTNQTSAVQSLYACIIHVSLKVNQKIFFPKGYFIIIHKLPVQSCFNVIFRHFHPVVYLQTHTDAFIYEPRHVISNNVAY